MTVMPFTKSKISGKSPFCFLFYAAAFKTDDLFYDQIRALSKKMSAYYPFNILSDADFFSIYTLFDPESNPVSLSLTNIPSIGLTFNKAIGKIEINTKNFSTKLEAIKINSISSEHNLKQVLKGNNLSASKCLLVVLLPPQGEGGFESEFESTSEDDFYFIATSCDSNWEQVIIRSMCKLMGLGDEFEYSDLDFEQPDSHIGKKMNYLHPNLMYLDTAFTSVPSADTKWGLLCKKVGFDFPIRKAPGHPLQADMSIPSRNFIPNDIELWEGGGGYRTKIYRSAHDCLMRRQIGNKNLPVRGSEVPLCPVCSAYVLQQILEFGRKRGEPSLHFKGFIK